MAQMTGGTITWSNEEKNGCLGPGYVGDEILPSYRL